MNTEIRPAEPEDAEPINRVLHAAWLATYPNEELGVTVDDIEDSFKDTFTEERIARGQERLRNLPENDHRLVAFVDGRMVGVSRLIREEKANHLQTLYVHPDFQGKGIGTALWEEMKKSLDPAKDTVLEVATYNQQAIGFYERLGFRDTGERLLDERFRMKSGSIIPELRMVLAGRTD
jgi:ribosomal protein S18 acetylase RimI-like enzyme